MDRRNLLASLAGVGVAGLAGCVSAPTTGAAPKPASVPETGVPENVDAPTETYVSGNTDFGLALLDGLAADAPGENRFVSPYSLGVALAMTYAGTRGETRTNVAETMRFSPTGQALHRSVAALRAALPLGDADGSAPRTTTAEVTDESSATESEGGAPFRLVGANALWGQAEYPFRENFLRTLNRYYGGGLGRVDFTEDPETARTAINRWVAERTREEIPELFPERTIDERTRFVLANAVSFRANWAETFDEEDTEPKEFTTLDGTTVEVPTMHQSERFPFAEVDGVKVLELPYTGENVAMAVLLPPRGEFREFERSLDAGRLGELLDATESREVKVRLPKFEFRSSLELSERLEAMGMTTAFTREANLDGMAEGDADANLKLGSVVHEAYVGVDEQGTEAAAATGVEVVFTGAALNQATFAADSPFLFVIRHRPTGAPLFLGRVADPTAD